MEPGNFGAISIFYIIFSLFYYRIFAVSFFSQFRANSIYQFFFSLFLWSNLCLSIIRTGPSESLLIKVAGRFKCFTFIVNCSFKNCGSSLLFERVTNRVLDSSP